MNRSSTTSSYQNSNAQKPHPRQALRNPNLPPLPDFEFPPRGGSKSPVPRIEEQPPTPVLPLFTPENSKDREIRERSTSRPRSRAVSGRVEGRARDICEGARERGRSFLGDKSSVITEEREEREQLDKRERKRKQLDREEKDKRVQERLKQDPKKLSNEKLAEMGISDMSKKGQWIFYAITSGACAAANGVFAKLTTTELTASIAGWLAHLFGLTHSTFFEGLIRAIFFGLNLLFNGIMWALFTKALSRSPSTTQVAILNTSSNFMITALLGWMIFSENLPGMWWVGACLLVAGNVIIGQREEKEFPLPGDERAEERAVEGGESEYRRSREEGARLLSSDDIELKDESEEAKRRAKVQEEEDLLDLPAGGSGSVRL